MPHAYVRQSTIDVFRSAAQVQAVGPGAHPAVCYIAGGVGLQQASY